MFVIPMLYCISAHHLINQYEHNFFRIHNVLAQWRGINTLHWNSYSIKVTITTTKDTFSQCTLQQQRFSKSKSTKEALRRTFTDNHHRQFRNQWRWLGQMTWNVHAVKLHYGLDGNIVLDLKSKPLNLIKSNLRHGLEYRSYRFSLDLVLGFWRKVTGEVTPGLNEAVGLTSDLPFNIKTNWLFLCYFVQC